MPKGVYVRKPRPGTGPNRGKGKGVIFLRGLIGHQDSDCILWPYSKLPTGYGHLGFNGKVMRAHRLMCVFAHGNPPTPKHEASHACHKPLCVNPRHLAWKTPSENQYDRRTHGTHGGGAGRRGKLTPIQWREIREAKGKVTQSVLSKCYGVAEGTIRGIQAGRWGTAGGTKTITHRGLTLRISDWAKEIGITQQAFRARLKLMPPAKAIDAPRRYSHR